MFEIKSIADFEMFRQKLGTFLEITRLKTLLEMLTFYFFFSKTYTLLHTLNLDFRCEFGKNVGYI